MMRCGAYCQTNIHIASTEEEEAPVADVEESNSYEIIADS